MQLFDDDDADDDDNHCATVDSFTYDSNQESTMGATHYTLHLNGNNKIEVTWHSATEKHLLTCAMDVATCIWNHYVSADSNITTINCCTEYMYKNIHNRLVMRCHPSYQGEGPWFDWVNVHLEAHILNGKVFPEGRYPCKVMAIVPKQQNAFIEETSIVVQRAQARTENDSVLFVEWELMEGYHIVAPNSIVENLFLLELDSNKIAVALPYSEWPSCFTDTSY
jgi:hypothetical protein